MASPGQQLVQLDFSAGINEAVRDESQDPTQGFLTLENIRKPQRGVAKKRYGFTALTRSAVVSSLTTGYKLFSDGQTTCVADATQIQAYSPTATRWGTASRYASVGLRTIDFGPARSNLNVYDVEYCNGFVCVASSDGTDSYSHVLDAATGAVINSSGGGAGVQPYGVASYGSRYFVLMTWAAGSITLQYFDTQTPASGWQALAIFSPTNMTGEPFICSMETRIALAYAVSAGTDRVEVRTYNISGQVGSTRTIPTTSVTPDWVDLTGSEADTLWVSWNQTTAVKVIGLDADNLAATLATAATVITTSSGTLVHHVVATTSGAGWLYAIDSAADGRNFSNSFSTSGGAVVASTAVTRYNFQAVSRPFYANGRTYVWGYPNQTLTTNVNEQNNLVLVDIYDDVPYVVPVAQVFPSLIPNPQEGALAWIKTSSQSANVWWTAISKRKSQGGNQALSLVRLDFGDSQRLKPCAHNSSTYLTGGLATHYDGQNVVEVGFLARPNKPTTGTTGTGISLTNGRRYVAVYEAIDGDGNWVVSGISDPSTITGAVVNKTVTVSIRPLTCTRRIDAGGSRFRIGVYATSDANNGLPPYYRVGYVANSTTASTVTFNDAVDETTLTSNPMLYSPTLPSSVGASLDRRAPPGLMHMVSYNGMLVGAAGSTLHYSGQAVEGEAVWFNPVFQTPVEGEGDITGLAAMDGALFVFKTNAIYMLSGEAPSDNGAAGGLGTPRRMASDVGCIDARSILVTSIGCFFQSTRGIEILTRSGTVDWVGEPVRVTTAAYPICTAATLDFVNRLAIFEMVTAESSHQVSGTGRGLVYDLTLQQWVSKDRRAKTGGTADAPAQSAAMVWTGSAWRYAWLDTSGYVYVEDTTTHLDAGSYWVTKRAETANARVGGMQGMQFTNRVLLLAKYATGHDHAMKLAYDYASTYGTTRTWTAAELASLTSALPNQQLEMVGDNNAEGQAVRLYLNDATPSSGSVGTGEGASWLGVAFELVPKAGAYRLPDASR